MENSKFYDSAAAYYDSMIGFEMLLERRINGLKPFAEGRSAAADLGCGTGVDTIALSRLGLKVTGFDNSENMILVAKNNALRLNADVSFVRSSLDRIPDEFSGRFDLVISLGNTLANLTPEQLAGACENIFNMLKPGGRFILQILNYEMITRQKERIVNIRETREDYTVRFYDFLPEGTLMFNILRFMKENPALRELITTQVYPHKYDFLMDTLIGAGFSKPELTGSLSGAEFTRESKDVVISAIKE